MVRLLNNKMNVSRNTVYNRFVKGSDHLKKVLPMLKEMLLAKDADAEYFISNIGSLYDLEEQYRLGQLTPQLIQQERQGEVTSKIIQKMRQRLD